MKKISTAAAQKIGKFAGHQLTIGLDLGDRLLWPLREGETARCLARSISVMAIFRQQRC